MQWRRDLRCVNYAADALCSLALCSSLLPPSRCSVLCAWNKVKYARLSLKNKNSRTEPCLEKAGSQSAVWRSILLQWLNTEQSRSFCALSFSTSLVLVSLTSMLLSGMMPGCVPNRQPQRCAGPLLSPSFWGAALGTCAGGRESIPATSGLFFERYLACFTDVRMPVFIRKLTRIEEINT